MKREMKMAIGCSLVKVTIVPDAEVAKANKRIQKKLSPALREIKRNRTRANQAARTIFIDR